MTDTPRCYYCNRQAVLINANWTCNFCGMQLNNKGMPVTVIPKPEVKKIDTYKGSESVEQYQEDLMSKMFKGARLLFNGKVVGKLTGYTRRVKISEDESIWLRNGW